MPLGEPASLGPVPADRHRAPAPSVGGVAEEPAAALAGALVHLDAAAVLEEGERGQGEGVQRGAQGRLRCSAASRSRRPGWRQRPRGQRYVRLPLWTVADPRTSEA